MKIISSEAHAALDYLTVVIFALAPTVIGLSGTAAVISYGSSGNRVGDFGGLKP
jgi:hypothetical protein